jgi:predicted 2-oxoglutarate/Fe(II)-dependent dioxygenase YbiX
MAVVSSLYYWERIYTPQEVKEINKHLAKDFSSGDFQKGAQDVVKTSTVRGVRWGKSKKYLQSFYDHIILRNDHVFGFKLFPITDYENLLHNTYKIGQEYGWHLDANERHSSDIKLTALLNLSSSPYQGGGLEITASTPQPVPELDEPGTMVIFPSFFLHRVAPILKGTRTSIALLVSGPKFV